MNISSDLASIAERITQITGSPVQLPGLPEAGDQQQDFASMVRAQLAAENGGGAETPGVGSGAAIGAINAPAMVPPAQIDSLVSQNSAQWNVDPALVKAIIANESGFNANATSNVAQAWMQLMPGTASGLGVTNAYDPAQNVGAMKYIKGLLDRFNGDVKMAVAAYNAGPGAVEKWRCSAVCRKHKITFRTSLPLENIARSLHASALVAFALLALTAQTPTPSLGTILRNHVAALRALHVRVPKTHETIGKLAGLGQVGPFHEWQDGEKQRRDDHAGLQSQHQLRVGDDLWIQNASGQVRQVHGILARREITQNFIDSSGFASHPEAVRFLERATLADGRTVCRLQVTPPDGAAFGVGIDAKSWLIDEETYNENDATLRRILDDYGGHGMLLLLKSIATATHPCLSPRLRVSKLITDCGRRVQATRADGHSHTPVTIPIKTQSGPPFIAVKIATYHFMIDSGSQGNGDRACNRSIASTVVCDKWSDAFKV